MLLKIILYYQVDQFHYLDILNTKIYPLVVLLSTVVEYFLFPFLATKEALPLLGNDCILSGRSIQ